MAWWAMWMFVATAATVLLTFAGLIAIIRTLHHTRRAADEAEKMAKEAAKATIAANDTFQEAKRANEIAQENLVAQIRPWITLEPTAAGPVELSGETVTVTIDVVVRNISKFPARLVIVDAKAYWTQTPSNWPTIAEVEALVAETKVGPYVQQKSSIILPNGDLPYGFVQLNASRYPEPRKGGRRTASHGDRPIYVLVACCVVYKSTISDKWHHTAHLMYVRRKTPEGAHPFDTPQIMPKSGRIARDDLCVSIVKFSAANSVS